jgi:hypothetical protein
MNDIHWEVVKEFYKEKFGIDGWVVEMYANLDILSLCASGACNETIERFLEIPLNEIEQVIKDTFDFDGWESDLPVNPYKIFTDAESLGEVHYADIRFISEMQSALINFKNRDSLIYRAYWVCKTMCDIERKIDDEWI